MHARHTFPCTVMVNVMFMLMTAESCSLASRSVTKAIVGFSSIVLLEYNTVDPSKRFSAPIPYIKADIIETHVKLLRYIYHATFNEKVRFHASCKFDALWIRLHSLFCTNSFKVVIDFEFQCGFHLLV